MVASTSQTSLTIGQCATLACLWEATAAKPGNVYRGADFEDLSYVDFLTSAAVIGPILEQTSQRGVGATVLAGVEATREAVATNTNLGILLLLAPLAAQAGEQPRRELAALLESLDVHDTQSVYQAIRLANPSGLGEVDEADVHEAPPAIPLVAAMQLAADRDLVARQYANGFAEVNALAERMERLLASEVALHETIVQSYLELLSQHPDSLVARKCGAQVAAEVSTRAAAVLASGRPCEEDYQASLADFDFYLRSDGHRRNPGTSADLVAAALFMLLIEQRIELPKKFY